MNLTENGAQSPNRTRSRKSKKRPSQWKVEHPTMAFRIDQKRRWEILQIRATTGIRLGELVYGAVKKSAVTHELAYKSGYYAGITAEIARPIPLRAPCRVCGKYVSGNLKDSWFQQWIVGGNNGNHPGCGAPGA